MRKSRQRRLAAAAALAVAMLTTFAALGGIGLAQAGITAAQYAYGKSRVTICHKGKVTIKVARPALRAHMRHGDTLGPCANGVNAAKKQNGQQVQQSSPTATQGPAKGQEQAEKGRAKAEEAKSKAGGRG